MAEKLREVWAHLVSHQLTRDLDGWVDSFAVDGVMEWPFRLKGVPPRLVGQQAIRAALGPVWERAKQSNRRVSRDDGSRGRNRRVRPGRRVRARTVPPVDGLPTPRSKRARAPPARVRRHGRVE